MVLITRTGSFGMLSLSNRRVLRAFVACLLLKSTARSQFLSGEALSTRDLGQMKPGRLVGNTFIETI